MSEPFLQIEAMGNRMQVVCSMTIPSQDPEMERECYVPQCWGYFSKGLRFDWQAWPKIRLKRHLTLSRSRAMPPMFLEAFANRSLLAFVELRRRSIKSSATTTV